MTKFLSAAKLGLFLFTLVSSAPAFANWIGDPLVLDTATSSSILKGMSFYHYPKLSNGMFETGITPEIFCSETKAHWYSRGVPSCSMIVLTKDIQPKDCSEFPPRGPAQITRMSDADGIEAYNKLAIGEFPVSDKGIISVGSQCGGMILRCDASGSAPVCDIEIY